MERETLEKLIKVLNNAVEENDNWELEEEISLILGNNEIFKLPDRSEEDDYGDSFHSEAIMSIINLLKYIKSKLKPEDQYFFIDNIHEVLKPFIQDDETKKRICLESLSDEDDEKRIAGYRTYNYRKQVILSIDNDDIKMSILDTIEDDSNRMEIIESMQKEQNIMRALTKVDIEGRRIIISKQSAEFILNNIREILPLIGITEKVEEKIERVKCLASRNSQIFATLQWELLEDKYFQLFSEEQLDIVCSYLDIQAKILNRLDDKKLELLKNILERLDNKDIQVFQLQFIRLINILSVRQEETLDHERESYDKLMQNLNFSELTEEDFDKLVRILQGPNFFGLETIDDVRHYEDIKNRVYDAIVNGESDAYREEYINIPYEKKSQLQFAVLGKLFGQDIESARAIVKKYGKDIGSLPDIEPEVQYVKSLQIILNANEELLRQLYDIDISMSTDYINPALIEVNLRHLYGREFNKGLCHVEELEMQEEGIYKAGPNFKMIVTSVGAFVENTSQNFMEDWNRDSVVSQGFCCSYITNDLINTAPVPHFLYGFNEMSEDALMMSGITDINSNAAQFNPEASAAEEYEIYYTPENQINNTQTIYMGFNEMVFKRFQNGIRKQPDYIVVIDEKNLEEAKKAAKQWAKNGVTMPIVIIDTEECIENNRKEIEQMIRECRTSKDLQKIKQRIENNKKWGIFYPELEEGIIELEEQYSGIEENENIQNSVNKEFLESAYNSTTELKRKEALGYIERISTEIQAQKQEQEQK